MLAAIDVHSISPEISVFCDKPFESSKSIKVLVDNPRDVTLTSKDGQATIQIRSCDCRYHSSSCLKQLMVRGLVVQPRRHRTLLNWKKKPTSNVIDGQRSSLRRLQLSRDGIWCVGVEYLIKPHNDYRQSMSQSRTFSERRSRHRWPSFKGKSA